MRIRHCIPLFLVPALSILAADVGAAGAVPHHRGGAAAAAAVRHEQRAPADSNPQTSLTGDVTACAGTCRSDFLDFCNSIHKGAEAGFRRCMCVDRSGIQYMDSCARYCTGQESAQADQVVLLRAWWDKWCENHPQIRPPSSRSTATGSTSTAGGGVQQATGSATITVDLAGPTGNPNGTDVDPEGWDAGSKGAGSSGPSRASIGIIAGSSVTLGIALLFVLYMCLVRRRRRGGRGSGSGGGLLARLFRRSGDRADGLGRRLGVGRNNKRRNKPSVSSTRRSAPASSAGQGDYEAAGTDGWAPADKLYGAEPEHVDESVEAYFRAKGIAVGSYRATSSSTIMGSELAPGGLTPSPGRLAMRETRYGDIKAQGDYYGDDGIMPGDSVSVKGRRATAMTEFGGGGDLAAFGVGSAAPVETPMTPPTLIDLEERFGPIAAPFADTPHMARASSSAWAPGPSGTNPGVAAQVRPSFDDVKLVEDTTNTYGGWDDIRDRPAHEDDIYSQVVHIPPPPPPPPPEPAAEAWEEYVPMTATSGPMVEDYYNYNPFADPAEVAAAFMDNPYGAHQRQRSVEDTTNQQDVNYSYQYGTADQDTAPYQEQADGGAAAAASLVATGSSWKPEGKKNKSGGGKVKSGRSGLWNFRGKNIAKGAYGAI
ncbi:hypothetical protein DFH27DRAFT_303925 [Peziza echinospora]|nr:hypothetical protein DFH27DRAFT_303925 [Peziza echinospora]